MDKDRENQPNTNFQNDIFNPKNIDFFRGDEYLMYIYKKTEKLVAALYIVSNLLDDAEPLKWNVRDKGLCFLGGAISLVTVGMSDREIIVNKLFSIILEILSMLEILLFAGLISQMNYRILAVEFNSILLLMETREKKDKEKEGYVLSEHFFESVEKMMPDNTHKNTLNIPPDQAHQSFSKKTLPNSSKTEGVERYFLKGQYSKVSAVNTASKNPKTNIKDISERKDTRRATIISLLKKQSNLTIKDFTKVIPGCSEKTIQRDLLNLVSEGVLKKDGERRWSTYSLK